MKQIKKIGFWLLVLFLLILICLPGIWIFVSAFRPNPEILSKPANWIPDISLKDLTDLHNKSSEKDERISNAIHEVIGLADKFYENGFAGLKYIPLSTRLGIFIAANVYRGIGIKIKSNKKKYLRERVYLNLLEKSLITVKSILLFIFLPFMKYKYQKIRDNLPNENL